MRTPGVMVLDHGARWSLGEGSARAAVLASLLVATTGLRVAYESGESRQREAAFAWTTRHDPAVKAAASAPGQVWQDRGLRDVGQGLVIAGPSRGVFDVSAFQPDDVDRGTLWAARAPALRRPGGPPEAALTLSCREADRLRSLGLPALSLLHSRTIWPTREPRSVAVSAGRDVADLLPAVLPRLRRALGPATTVRLLASDVLDVGRARFAPVHTEARTRVIEAADLVVAVGESSGAGLDVFEAALHGTPVVRWSTAAASFEPDPAGHDDEGTGWMRRATSGTSLTPVRGPADDQTRTATRPELSRWAEELLDLPFS